jgi:hypothetical protein
MEPCFLAVVDGVGGDGRMEPLFSIFFLWLNVDV